MRDSAAVARRAADHAAVSMAAVALHGETQKRQAKMMCEAAELKRLAAANARAELGRRQRLRVRALRAA